MTIAGKALISAALTVTMQGQALLNTLTGIPAQAAGQTVAQYMAAEGIAQTATLSNGATIAYDVLASGSQATAAVSSGTTAAQAAAAWSGASSATGAASQVAVESIAPKVAIEQAASGTAVTGGLLTMSLPAWTAAAAPLLGVGLGYGLYKTNPEFWEKVSRKLLPFAYEDSSAMPAYVDKDGQVYIDKDATDALKELFEEEGVGPAGTGYIPADNPDQAIPGNITSGSYSYDGESRYECPGARFFVDSATRNQRFACSTSQGEVLFYWHPYDTQPAFRHNMTKYTYNSTDFYMYVMSGAASAEIVRTAYAVLYGDYMSEGVFPEGTSQWTGDRIDFPP